MIPGGSTEVISYFSGYLHLFEDIARDREVLNGSPQTASDKDAAGRPAGDDVTIEFDDVQLARLPSPVGIPTDVLQFIRAPLPHPHKLILPDLDEPDALQRVPPQPPFGAGAGGGGSSFEVKVIYHPGGEQSEIEVRQVNALFDDDDVIGTNNPAFSQHLLAVSDQQLGSLVHQASEAVPETWKLPHDTSSIISALGAMDQGWQDTHGGSSNPPSVELGYYLNGEAQRAAPDALDQTLTSPFDGTPADTGHGLGQWADVGDNHTTNAAQIIDFSASCKTLVVLGDYYSTNAIFQVNGCASSDLATTAGSSNGSSGGVSDTPDVTTNAAGFIQHASVYSGIEGGFAAHWDVDVVNGNYYNVHTLTQINYLSDNDVVQQQSSDTHYDVVAGGNHMMNLADITNGEFRYDLIIVGGSYHSANFVYQYNILVNNDIIKTLNASGCEGDGGQFIEVGGNALTNAATIDIYGGQNFNPMSANLQQVVDDIEHGQANMDPSLAALIESYSGTLHILYVTGDYYDVNAIWQTNLIEDCNYVSQTQAAPSAANPYVSDGAATQSVIAGHDTALNLASVVQVGPDQTYVNGQVYSDSVLVQSELLPQSSGCGPSPSPDALATEVVAFINDTTIHDPTPQPVVHVTTTVNDDPMASVMH